MKLLLYTFILITGNTLAQISELNYKWTESNSPSGFYATYKDMLDGTILHKGPYEVRPSLIKCAVHERCKSAELVITSAVKAEIFPMSINYLHDGSDVYIIFREVNSFGFGRHVEADPLQNFGRYCYFERFKYDQGRTYKRPFIVDLKTNTVYKPSRKNLEMIFKENMDLLKVYEESHEQKKLLIYITRLNQKLGYIGETLN